MFQKLFNMFIYKMKTYPWFKKYKTIFEQSNDYVSMCFLSLDVIDGIINKYNVSNHE